MIRAVSRTSDDVVFTRVIQLLYVQARMTGQYDDQSDRLLLSSALADLIAVAVGVEEGPT